MVDAPALRLQQTCPAHDNKVWSLSWHHGGNLVATGSSDKLIKIWGRQPDGTFTHKSTLDGGHTKTIRCVTWKPGCRVGSLCLASSSFDATACIWL